MSQWYVAHILMKVTLKEGELDYLPMWENIHLIKAENSDEAFAKADEIGEAEAVDDSMTFDGKPASWKYMGVRRMAECLEDLDQLESGMEITYLSYSVRSDEDVNKMLGSKPVRIILEDREWGDEDAYHPELLETVRRDDEKPETLP